MNSYFKLAWRNLWRNRKRTLITLSSIGFAVLISSFMRGMQLGTYDKMFNDAIRSTSGHFKIMGKGYKEEPSLEHTAEVTQALDSLLKSLSQIERIVPKVESMILASSGNYTRPVFVFGVDPELESFQSGLDRNIIEGEYITSNEQSVLIGDALANLLHLSIGDTLTLYGSGYHGMTAAGLFVVKGIYRHPNKEMNKKFIYMPITAAQYLFYMDNRVTGLAVILKDPSLTEKTQSIVESILDTSAYEVHHWKELNKELVQNMEMDNISGRLMLGILYMVVGFGIFGTIFMMTMERRKEFSVMIALGMKRIKVATVVVIETFYIAIIGGTTGLILSIPLIAYFQNNPIEITGEAAEMYYQYNMEPILVISDSPENLINQLMIVLLMSMIGSMIPLISVFRFDIVKILRGR